MRRKYLNKRITDRITFSFGELVSSYFSLGKESLVVAFNILEGSLFLSNFTGKTQSRIGQEDYVIITMIVSPTDDNRNPVFKYVIVYLLFFDR